MSKPWGRLCQIFVPFSEKLNFNSNFVSIWMSHWCRRATEGAEFRNTCKWLAFLSSFSHLQVIQNKRPLVLGRGICDSCISGLKNTNMLTLELLINSYVHSSVTIPCCWSSRPGKLTIYSHWPKNREIFDRMYFFNISSWRKRGSASNHKMEYQVLPCIFH